MSKKRNPGKGAFHERERMIAIENENERMNAEEILELLELTHWSRARLADEMDITENAVIQWLSRARKPSGPASRLLRLWLKEAREGRRLTSVR